MTFLRQSSCFTATVLQKLNMQSNFKLHTAAFTAVFLSNHLDEELFLLYPFFTGSFPYCLKLQGKLNVVFINHLPVCSFFLKTVFILLQIHFLLPPLCPAQGGSTPHGAGQPAVQHSGCGSIRPSFGQAGLAPAANSRAAAQPIRCQQRDLSLIQGEHHEPSHQRHPRGCQIDRTQDPQAGHSLHHRVVCPAGSPGLLSSVACICCTQPSLF